MMEIVIINKETIKPSSPTSPHLKKRMISLLDQLAPAKYTPLLLFFRPTHVSDDISTNFTEMSQCLKQSLSETLALFYPIAGRFKDNVSIDCNDEGVDYIEARVDCLLHEILENPVNDVLCRLVSGMHGTCDELIEGCQLLVQMNLFKCGGIAIGLSFSHKLFDVSGISDFLKAWSSAALKTSGLESVVVPDFTTTSSTFPPLNEIPMSWKDFVNPEENSIIKMFVFDALKIGELKSKVASECDIKPTRVEAVSALIWKCTMKSDLEGSRKPYAVGISMNMRKILVPPFPEHSMGNVVGMFTAQVEDNETDLGTLANLLRKEKIEACHFMTRIGGEISGNARIFDILKKLENTVKTCRFLTHSSCCRIPFYEVDFGWGKPTWVGLPINPYAGNVVMLIDSNDGVGVEAYVSLRREEMAVFERDPELLAFASVKSSVCNIVV